MKQSDLKRLKEAFVKFNNSRGCGCCEDFLEINESLGVISEILGFERYDDDSGWDISLEVHND